MSPSLLLSLVMRLPDTSLTVALMMGGREYMGWGKDRAMRADLYDAQNLTTRATGNWDKKPPDIPFYPRPWDLQAEAEKKPTSVKDLFYRRFRQG